MDQGPGNSEERGRLGRERGGESGQDFGGRPHPPEQYPGHRPPDERGSSGGRDLEDDRGYDDPGSGYRDRDDRARSEYPYGGGAYGEQRGSGGKGWGIAALILSVLALIGAFVLAFFNLVLAIPGLILGIVARRKGSRGLGLTAIVLSIIAILLGIVVTVAVGALLLNSPEFQQVLQEAQ
ncbi:DUF4190 domain-containing protein [Rubrobacter indicoceani]|uniref:DUF4190 domain-containing protein n=1 Tax=Rubrobacter indicoceani TaxID=2051957 RepID=UPI000E5AD695|nr:DUF4190 domain-containing protein [Rubrobacter indicoceani]